MTLQRALAEFEELIDPVAVPVLTGLVHETYEVSDTHHRRFILQRINPLFSRGIHHNIATVTEHLTQCGVETFHLVLSKGKPYIDLGAGGLWRLMTRIPGVSFDCPESAEHAYEAGKLVASFHRALFDFDTSLHSIGFAFHDTRQHLEDLSLALQEFSDHPLHEEISKLANKLFEHAGELPSLDGAPNRIIHGDLKFNNLLFEPANKSQAPRPVALIDLDTISQMPLAFDWGDALRSWCNRRAESEPEAELDLSLVRATTNGLLCAFESRPSVVERESLSWGLEIVSLELSTRFATDALRERYFAWNPERFESAGAHNRDRALGQFDLYRQARRTHDERARDLFA